jgi:hypothetical protein
MLVGGFDGYPEGVLVAEEIQYSPILGNEEQVMLSGVPKMYSSLGGPVLAVLPFDSTGVPVGTDGAAVIEEAMRAWVAFRHMERVP